MPTQAPFNPKDWSLALPASILALGFLVYIGVWAAEKLGLTRKNGNGKARGGPIAGDLRPEEWDLRIGNTVRRELEGSRQMLQQIITNQADMQNDNEQRTKNIEKILERLDDRRR